MKFCSECHNMYYLKISDVEGIISNTLIYYCRNCGNEDASLGEETICVSDIQLKRSEQKYTHIVNEYTKYDPTLPRINSIKCPNQECVSNAMSGGGGTSKKTATATATAKSLKKYVDSATKSAADAMASAKESEKTLKAIELQVADAQAQADDAEDEDEAQKKSSLAENESGTKTNREVMYIRYDDINMKYVYVCVHCNTTWKTDHN